MKVAITELQRNAGFKNRIGSETFYQILHMRNRMKREREKQVWGQGFEPETLRLGATERIECGCFFPTDNGDIKKN